MNHAVTVTGVAVDPGNGKSAEFVSAVIMRVAWQDAGGWSVVTDGVHLQLASRRPGKLPERDW